VNKSQQVISAAPGRYPILSPLASVARLERGGDAGAGLRGGFHTAVQAGTGGFA